VKRIVTWVAAALVAAAWLGGMSAAARADVYDDTIGAASRGKDDIWVFARRSSDGAILERHYVPSTGAWSSWSSIGGTMSSGPAAVAYGPNIEVFARGNDGATWGNALVNGAWSGWSSLGGYATSAPAAIARRGTNYLDVAIKGGDNAIWLNTYIPGSGWHGWGSLGGNLTSAPALDSHSDGILDVFARGTDGAVYQQGWNGSQWFANWVTLSGGIIGPPSAVNKQPHDLDVYVRGGANAVYQNHWDSVNSWTGWVLLDRTPVSSSPVAVSDSAGRELLFTRSADKAAVKVWTVGGGWSQWQDFGTIAVPAPAPPTPPDGEVTIIAGVRCTPPGGKVHVKITIRTPRGKAKARVSRIVFFTKGKGHHRRVDRKAPYSVRLRINKPAGKVGRVYARVYYRRSKHGKLHKKTVSRRYVVCR
jgi:hypothetical protein